MARYKDSCNTVLIFKELKLIVIIQCDECLKGGEIWKRYYRSQEQRMSQPGEGGSDFTEKVTQKSFLKDEWGFSKLS